MGQKHGPVPQSNEDVKTEVIMADNTKVWYKSKGMWAGALTFLFGIYAVAQASLTNVHLPSITAYMPFVFTILGALGVYGRMSADGKITFSDQSSN